MIHESILNIEKSWKKVKTTHREEAFMAIPVPVIFARSPSDAEFITNQLSRYIYAEKILLKTTPRHEDYLLFSVPYIPQASKNFPAIQELYQFLRSAGGYYGTYRGIILADVSEWREHFRDKYFDIFLAYLADLRTNGLIPFFYADCKDYETDISTLVAVISSYFKPTQISIDAEALCKYAVALFADRKILLTENAHLYLTGFIGEISRSVLFHGTESVKRICTDIIDKCKAQHIQGVLDDSQLKTIISNLGYTNIYHDQSKKTIGFR